jgi:hypothetical protein
VIDHLRDLSNRLRDSGRYTADDSDLAAATLIDDAIAALSWQPIETCPPAPTRVLLWFPALGYPVTGTPEAYAYKTGSWKATHWMPLPAPPQPTGDV